MEVHPLHVWNVTPSEAVRIQDRLRAQIRLEPYRGRLRLIAGADISFERFSDDVFASIVVLELPSLRVVARASAAVRAPFPYIPGLLSFREAPALLKAWGRLRVDPDVVVFDGQGIAHPRRIGIASHVGLWIDRPTIGCAKSLLLGHYSGLPPTAGSQVPLLDRGEQIGVALRTRARVNPVFASPGHRMDFGSAARILLQTTSGYRIPEPTRQAHLRANELRRAAAA